MYAAGLLERLIAQISSQACVPSHQRTLRLPALHLHHHQSSIQRLAQSLPGRPQRSGRRRAPHRALGTLRLQRQGIPHETLNRFIQPRPRGDDSSVSEEPRSQRDSRLCLWPAGGRVLPRQRLAPWQPVIPLKVAPNETGGDSPAGFLVCDSLRGIAEHSSFATLRAFVKPSGKRSTAISVSGGPIKSPRATKSKASASEISVSEE